MVHVRNWDSWHFRRCLNQIRPHQKRPDMESNIFEIAHNYLVQLIIKEIIDSLFIAMLRILHSWLCTIAIISPIGLRISQPYAFHWKFKQVICNTQSISLGVILKIINNCFIKWCMFWIGVLDISDDASIKSGHIKNGWTWNQTSLSLHIIIYFN